MKAKNLKKVKGLSLCQGSLEGSHRGKRGGSSKCKVQDWPWGKLLGKKHCFMISE